MKSKTTVKEFNFIRERQYNLMYDWMKEYHEKQLQKIRPNVKTLEKKDYTNEWYKLLDGEYPVEMFDSFGSYYENLLSCNVLQLKKVFEWVLNHYAELDLGAEDRRRECTDELVDFLKNNEWTKANERALILFYLEGTRWYDF